jgi:protein TonB
MSVPTSIAFILWTLAATAQAAHAGDAQGCADLKLLPRLDGCIIQECSAKQHDSFDAGDPAPLDANTNSLTYSCPASMDTQRVKRELDAQIHKAGYLYIAEDKTDPANPTATARQGSHWLRWSASSEDGATTYSVIGAESATEKFKAEACAEPQVLSLPKTCQIVECTSKAEDSVGMRTAQKEQTSIAGNVETVALACPANGPAQTLGAAEEELKRSGFEILFSASGWLTGRAGKRWVELVSVPDGESVSYALTVVPSAELLTASTPEPKPVAASTPKEVPVPLPVPEPKLVQVAAQIPIPVAPISAPQPAPVAPAPPVPETPQAAATPTTPPVFVPPKVILQVPIDPTHDRIFSVAGDVVINMLVDVGEDGSVSNPVLTGHITKDVLKLQSAALEAVSHWRFEPARQDGRIVPAVKINVQMHFHGRPWRL